MKKLMIIAAVAAVAALCGCSVKEITYEKDVKGTIKYSIYENEHWLNTEATSIKGGMTEGGRFEWQADGMKSSPSEEFNRTMQTYTTAFVQLAQIAAAAYNPSSTGVASAKAAGPTQTVVNVQVPAATTNAVSAAATTSEAK